MKIIKRDGSEVPYDYRKIIRAIDAANQDVVVEDRISDIGSFSFRSILLPLQGARTSWQNGNCRHCSEKVNCSSSEKTAGVPKGAPAFFLSGVFRSHQTTGQGKLGKNKKISTLQEQNCSGNESFEMRELPGK